MTNPSKKPGMGAIPYLENGTKGTTFRVWAKFATEVYVCGSFNHWSTSNPLVSEENGYWSVDVPGAYIEDRYRYLIKSSYTSPQGHWKTDPYCRNVEDNDNDDGIITLSTFDWGNDIFQMPNRNELVIYELHISSFRKAGEAPGSFNSLINKLNYLKDLGINAIQILPIFGFPGDYSWGYNPSFPFDIESHYGFPDDFKKLVDEAHKRGIAVILDVVYNHFGKDELDECLRRFDGWYENDKDGIYFYNDWRSETAFGPRPDFGRGEVRQFISDNALMWLEEYQVDGLRFDSTVNIRNAKGNGNDPANDLPEGWTLMQLINEEINNRMPWKLTIAEDLQNNDWITKDTAIGGAGFDSQWNSYYYHKLHQVIVGTSDESRDMFAVRDALLHRFENDPYKGVVYINNHDECGNLNNKYRLCDQIWLGHADSWVVRKRYTLAAGILFTSPGIPLIFQGDEFLEWGQWSDAGTLDWDKKAQFSGIWDLYQTLIRLRRNWFNNTRGLRGPHVNVFHNNINDKVIAYHRWENGGKGDDVIVVANFANRAFDSYTVGFPNEGTWYVRFNSDWNGFSADFSNHPGYDTTAGRAIGGSKDKMAYEGNIGIGPYSLLILSQ